MERREIAVLIDESGSVSHLQDIFHTNTLRLFDDPSNQGCVFHLFGFSTDVKHIGTYLSHQKGIAQQDLLKTHPHLGGTNLLNAVQATQKVFVGSNREIVIFTDGLCE